MLLHSKLLRWDAGMRLPRFFLLWKTLWFQATTRHLTNGQRFSENSLRDLELLCILQILSISGKKRDEGKGWFFRGNFLREILQSFVGEPQRLWSRRRGKGCSSFSSSCNRNGVVTLIEWSGFRAGPTKPGSISGSPTRVDDRIELTVLLADFWDVLSLIVAGRGISLLRTKGRTSMKSSAISGRYICWGLIVVTVIDSYCTKLLT